MPRLHEPRMCPNNKRHSAQDDRQAIAEDCRLGRMDKAAKYASLKPRARCYCPGIGRWIWADSCRKRQAARRLVPIIEEQCSNCQRGK